MQSSKHIEDRAWKRLSLIFYFFAIAERIRMQLIYQMHYQILGKVGLEKF